MSSPDAAQLQATIATLEAQRGLLGDTVVDTALAPLRAQLAALQAAATPEPAAQVLRLVSILFMDIVGSTSLSRKLDPEETAAVMDGTLTRCTAHVQQHGGRVLQYAGDNLLAVFGADEAREDDAERAVRCGLALVAEGAAIGAEVLARHGHAGFQVRVGVHSGSVLLGGGVDAEGSIRGMPVNIAARMEQSAPPGGLRISHDTWQLVRGLFDAQAQPPIDVKGLDAPIATWLVQRVRPRSFRTTVRGVEGISTRMVGRDAELQALCATFTRVLDSRLPAALLVVAEAGIGKSRLLHEFSHWVAGRGERFIVLQGRADPSTQNQPFGLLRDVLAWRLGIAHDDSEAVAKSKVEAGIAPLFADDGPELAEAHAHLLGHLIGLDYAASPHVRGILDDPKQIRTRAFHTAAQAFRRVAARDGATLLLQLDDLHWSDDGSLEFLAHLLKHTRDVPMLVLGLTRPTLFERRDDWRDPPHMRRLDLSPLDKSASRQLAEALLHRLPSVPAALSELLTGRADGNPLFMEELVKMLVDQGALLRDGEHWSLNPDRLLATAVPPTLTGILQARLDGLPATERLALQQASVIGLVFWEPTLQALDERAPQALPSLVRRQLTLPRADTGLDGAAEYGFGNQILHDVTYDTLLKRQRRELHARAADWFAANTGVRAGGLLGTAAEHYEKAGDAAHAAEFYARAALQARRRWAHEVALDYVGRALSLVGSGDEPAALELRWRLLDIRERTLDLQGRRPEQRADLEALRALAERLDDPERCAEVAVRRALLAGRSGDLHGQESLAREAMVMAQRSGNAAIRLNAQRLMADSWARLGDAAAGEALAQQGLAEARLLGLADPESRLLNALAVIASQRGDVVAVLEYSRQATALRRQLGDRRNEAIGLSSQGGSWLELGAFERAREALTECLRLHRAMGDHAMEPIATANLSQLALWEGDVAEARRQAEAALATAMDVQAQYLQVFALWCLGDALLAVPDRDGAGRSFLQALETAQALGSPTRHDANAGLARVALARGDIATALAHLQELLAAPDEAAALEGTLGAMQIRLTAWRVLSAAGDARGPALLQRAHAALQNHAATLSDAALRQSYLERVPPHRDVLRAWQALGRPGPSPGPTA